MTAPPVVFDGIWKKFQRGEGFSSIRDMVPGLVKRAFSPRPKHELSGQEFWALQDVSFEVQRGQALGIIGPNGAGKSTTLKLLTRILKPTRGRYRVTGRVGALIEIAAGFHGDLTGRENVYLQGAIMGMKRAEIARNMDAIIDFANVRPFIDTQVKRYSSGMNARLGFAIAAHLEPDVLIIDEVLSVGDMAFQRKCIERMEQFKRQDVAIVFVSHNLQAVSSLCDQAMYLHGRSVAYGPTDQVIGRYIEEAGDVNQASDSAVTIRARLLTDGAVAPSVSPGTALVLNVSYSSTVDVADYSLGFIVRRSTDQLVVYDGNFSGDELGSGTIRAGSPLTVQFTFHANLTRGHYHVECHLQHTPTQDFLGRLRPAANFAVHEARTWSGIADLAVAAVAKQPQPSHALQS
jgi:lipopolysaccharide transport system ATP-binding protein